MTKRKQVPFDKESDLPVETRSGRKVRIFATDLESDMPILGAVWDEEFQKDVTFQWYEDGTFSNHSAAGSMDLVNIQEGPLRLEVGKVYEDTKGRKVLIARDFGDGCFEGHVIHVLGIGVWTEDGTMSVYCGGSNEPRLVREVLYAGEGTE